MVHALEEIHRLLKEGGTLIDIHPPPEHSLGQVWLNGAVVFSEQRPAEEADLEDCRQADLAQAQVVQRGLFALEAAREFDLITHAASVQALHEGMEAYGAFSNAVKSEAEEAQLAAFGGRLHQAQQAAGPGAEIAYREWGRISRLRRL